MKAAGIGGELRVGYQRAARLGQWSLASAGEGSDHWLISVQLAQRDEFWMEQNPSRVVLELGELSWTWDNIEFDGSSLIRVSGPPREGVVSVEE